MTDSPNTTYDNIIIGAGHNGLVCAAYLAMRGQRVLVLEAGDQIGGAALTREIVPGVKAPAFAHILNMLQPKIISDLDLKLEGRMVDTVSLQQDSRHVQLGHEGISGEGLRDEDIAAYTAFIQRMKRHARALAPQLMSAPPRLASTGFANSMKLAKLGWDLRFGLGKKGMQDFLRIVGSIIYDVLNEEFDDTRIKGALAFDAILGSGLAPRMPGSVLNLMYRLAGHAGGIQGGLMIPSGGMGAVSDALATAARSHGAEIRVNARVQKINVDAGRASGVTLENGEKLNAGTVISNADPKTTMLGLLGARHLEAGFAHRVNNMRNGGRVAKMNIVLNGLPEFTGLDEAQLTQRLVIAPDADYVERAFNPSKYGELPKRPALEITIPSLGDDSLATGGKHVLSIIAQYVPTKANGGWEKAKAELAANIIDTIADYAPDIREHIDTHECLTPEDIERQTGNAGGHWHHAELAIDQMFMMRPVHGASQYKMPVDGLYLCGAGAHPGGGVMGAAGHNAAAAILAGEAS